jgi:hypothetical protein
MDLYRFNDTLYVFEDWNVFYTGNVWSSKLIPCNTAKLPSETDIQLVIKNVEIEGNEIKNDRVRLPMSLDNLYCDAEQADNVKLQMRDIFKLFIEDEFIVYCDEKVPLDINWSYPSIAGPLQWLVVLKLVQMDLITASDGRTSISSVSQFPVALQQIIKSDYQLFVDALGINSQDSLGLNISFKPKRLKV